MVFPSNACLELTLYFKSPSLGKIMFIAVDASPDDNSEAGMYNNLGWNRFKIGPKAALFLKTPPEI